MSGWTKRQRFEAVMAGEPADRPPVSAWRHFVDRERDAAALAEAMVGFQRQFDWDFVKINPRATYYAEAWGNVYDYARYDGVVPAVTRYVVHRPVDVEKIEELNPDEAAPFREQLEVVRSIRRSLGPEIPILQTLFSPLAVLEYLAGHRTLASNRPAVRESSPLPGLMAENPDGVHRALKRIARTLAGYARAAVQAGADGIFYAVLGLARDGYLTEDEYREFGRPYDVEILDALSGAPVMLHTCGPEAHPERFAYPAVRAIHWADRAAGNPDLADSARWIAGKAAVGGVDETLFSSSGQRDEVVAQARGAIRVMSGRPFILAPGCGVPVNAAEECLRALREAAEERRQAEGR